MALGRGVKENTELRCAAGLPCRGRTRINAGHVFAGCASMQSQQSTDGRGDLNDTVAINGADKYTSGD